MNNILNGLAQASNRAIAQQICKVVQAAHVRQPEIRGSVRIRGLVIEHDGFQVRLAPKAHVDCVLLRDLPGEAEGAGAGFIAHPLTTERADWFVIAVQRDIAAIVQAFQAHGQKKKANLGAAAHSGVSEKTVIFCLPGGAGKSYLAPMLAQHLGMDRIIDGWYPASEVTPGAMHVTNAMPTLVPPGVTAIYSE